MNDPRTDAYLSSPGPEEASYEQVVERCDALMAERDTLRSTLRWVALRYAQTLDGKSVRDADECLEAARILTSGSGS